MNTLWESIVSLAGDERDQPVTISEAIARSAVGDKVAEVEIRRFIADGLLIEGEDGTVRLSGRGQRMGADLHPGSSLEDLKADESANEAPAQEMTPPG